MVRNVLSPEEVGKLERAGDYLDAHAEEVWDARGQERNLLAVDPDNFLPMLTHPVALPLVAQLCDALPFPSRCCSSYAEGPNEAPCCGSSQIHIIV